MPRRREWAAAPPAQGGDFTGNCVFGLTVAERVGQILSNRKKSRKMFFNGGPSSMGKPLDQLLAQTKERLVAAPSHANLFGNGVVKRR